MLGCYITAFPLLLWGTANTGDIGTGTARKLFDKAALKDVAFWIYTFANFFLFCGYLVPFFYIPTYAELELGITRSLALYSVVIAQGVSVVGRLLASAAALRIGVMIPWLTCGLVSAILCLTWIGITDTTSFLAFAGLYGKYSMIHKASSHFYRADSWQVVLAALSSPYHPAYFPLSALIQRSWAHVLEWLRRSAPLLR